MTADGSQATTVRTEHRDGPKLGFVRRWVYSTNHKDIGTLYLAFSIVAGVVGARSPANPWGEGATTLEWTVSSPPPFYSFDELPRVT